MDMAKDGHRHKRENTVEYRRHGHGNEHEFEHKRESEPDLYLNVDRL
jgi:hypothetical protein